MAAITGRQVLETALHIMNEDGSDSTYETRALALLNSLIAECVTAGVGYNWDYTGDVEPLEDLDAEIEALDTRLCMAALPYGLAGLLYLDEDPARAGSWWSIYQERLVLCKRERPAEWEPIEDVYGGPDYRWTTRW